MTSSLFRRLDRLEGQVNSNRLAHLSDDELE
jgi:hypothetical protein